MLEHCSKTDWNRAMEDKDFRWGASHERQVHLLRLRLDSDLKIAQSPIGGVVLQLRQRASRARGRAFVFLGTLVFTVVAGLAFYLGLPFWQIYSDGSKRALEGEKTHIEALQGSLDAERAKLVDHEVPVAAGPKDFGGLVQLLQGMPQEVDPRIMAAGKRIMAAGKLGIETYPLDWIVTGSEVEIAKADSVQYSKDGGMSFRRLDGPRLTDYCCLYGFVQTPSGPLVFGTFGMIATAPGLGQTFVQVVAGLNGFSRSFLGGIATSDATLVFGDNGAVFRSTGHNLNFARVTLDPAQFVGNFYRAVQLHQAILLFDWSGAVFRSDDDGLNFRQVALGSEKNNSQILGGIATPDAMLIFGADGAVFRSTDEGKSFEPLAGGLSDFHGPLALEGATIAGDSILLYGERFAVFRSIDDGQSFVKVESGLGDIRGYLSGDITAGKALLLFGSLDVNIGSGNAAVLTRSFDNGKSFLALPSPSNNGARRAANLNGAPILLTDGGTIIHFTDQWSDAFANLTLAAGENGDTALRQVLDDQKFFPILYRNWPPVVAISNKLDQLIARRETDAAQITELDTRIAELTGSWLTTLSGTRAQQDFASFMQTCRDTSTHPVTGAEYASLTQSCLEAHGKVDDQAGGAWWATLSRQLPAGVLLMFMLVTLGALYRYNLRLAAFHDSRADVLDLVASGSTPETLRQILQTNPGDILNRLTLAFGADKIDAGSIRMKLAEAEIALAETAVRLDAAADPK